MYGERLHRESGIKYGCAWRLWHFRLSLCSAFLAQTSSRHGTMHGGFTFPLLDLILSLLQSLTLLLIPSLYPTS